MLSVLLVVVHYMLIYLFQTEKENSPHTVKDIKLISAGRILENNRTVGECRSPLCDIPGGVMTMHVVVQQPMEKGRKCSLKSYLSSINFDSPMLLNDI